jgi:hypothetical protein
MWLWSQAMVENVSDGCTVLDNIRCYSYGRYATYAIGLTLNHKDTYGTCMVFQFTKMVRERHRQVLFKMLNI